MVWRKILPLPFAVFLRDELMLQDIEDLWDAFGDKKIMPISALSDYLVSFLKLNN